MKKLSKRQRKRLRETQKQQAQLLNDTSPKGKPYSSSRIHKFYCEHYHAPETIWIWPELRESYEHRDYSVANLELAEILARQTTSCFQPTVAMYRKGHNLIQHMEDGQYICSCCGRVCTKEEFEKTNALVEYLNSGGKVQDEAAMVQYYVEPTKYYYYRTGPNEIVKFPDAKLAKEAAGK